MNSWGLRIYESITVPYHNRLNGSDENDASLFYNVKRQFHRKGRPTTPRRPRPIDRNADPLSRKKELNERRKVTRCSSG